MKLAQSFFFGTDSEKIIRAKQMGVAYAVIGASGDVMNPENENGWDYMPMLRMCNRFRNLGVDPIVIEGPPPLDKVKLGLDGRDEEISVLIDFLHTMQGLGLKVLCYNWMPVISWFRTSETAFTRGGALAIEFQYEQIKPAPMTWAGEVSEEALWDNLDYFLKRIVPVAEETGIQLAIHPDDPPVSPIRGISRILTNQDAFQRVIDLYESQNPGIKFTPEYLGWDGYWSKLVVLASSNTLPDIMQMDAQFIRD